MAECRRDFIPNDRSEMPLYTKLLGSRPIIDLHVMVRSNGQLDPLARNRDQPFVQRSISMARMCERMDVRIARNITWRRNFPADGQSFRLGLADAKVDSRFRAGILEASTGKNLILPFWQLD